MSLPDIKFEQVLGSEVSDSLLTECAVLFSDHYGLWSKRHPDSRRAGHRIRMTAARLRTYLVGERAWLAVARLKGQVIGYAFATSLQCRQGLVSWVTQLVVHTDYQNQLVGSRLLSAAWSSSGNFAWGIASANPFAIRALEKATRRRCNPSVMLVSRKAIRSVLDKVPYLRGRPLRLTSLESAIDTDFPQNISELPTKLELVRARRGWALGSIKEGEEWLAVTFRRQRQERWSQRELREFIEASSDIARDAYERMAASQPQKNHPWARPGRAEEEIAYLIEALDLRPSSTVLDFGCGAGRHSVALGKKGFKVLGIDFSKTAICLARAGAQEAGLGEAVQFIEADCREFNVEQQFDAALCLYDVIGSFPEDEANRKILERLAAHVVPGGAIAASVMSYEYMDRISRYRANDTTLDALLCQLEAVDTMQASGEVFSPESVLDPRSRVVYRKERFDIGSRLPVELIVRDRRFTIDEIESWCRKAGLQILSSGFVRAGRFGEMAPNGSDPKKEILVLARKSLI